LVVLGYSALPCLTVVGAAGFADSDIVDSGSLAVVFAVVRSGEIDLSGYSDTVSAAIVSAAIRHRSFVRIH